MLEKGTVVTTSGMGAYSTATTKKAIEWKSNMKKTERNKIMRVPKLWRQRNNEIKKNYI